MTLLWERLTTANMANIDVTEEDGGRRHRQRKVCGGSAALQTLQQFLCENNLHNDQDLSEITVPALVDRWLTFVEKRTADPIHFHTRNRALRYLDTLVPGTFEAAGALCRRDRLRHAHIAVYLRLSQAAHANPDANAKQWELCGSILESLPQNTGSPLLLSAVRDILRIAHRLPSDPSTFASMDHAELRALGATPRAFGHLDRAKRQPQWDPDGRYTSHLCSVTKAFMETHPKLWVFPVCLARALEKWVPVVEDRAHFLLLATAIADARVAALPKREAGRVRTAVAEDMCHIVRSLCDNPPYHHEAPDSIRQLLPFTCTREHLVDVLARIQARTNRRRGELQAAAESEYRNRKALVFLNGAIQKGLFEPNIRATETVAERELHPRMQELERMDATRWRSTVPETPLKDEEFLPCWGV